MDCGEELPSPLLMQRDDLLLYSRYPHPMSALNISIPGSHPYAEAIALATVEFEMGHRAVDVGNMGRARVCGRRAVGVFLQKIAPMLETDYGSHAMANLRGIQEDNGLPDEIRSAAERLLGGIRSINAGKLYSDDPLADAALVIGYFVKRTS